MVVTFTGNFACKRNHSTRSESLDLHRTSILPNQRTHGIFCGRPALALESTPAQSYVPIFTQLLQIMSKLATVDKIAHP